MQCSNLETSQEQVNLTQVPCRKHFGRKPPQQRAMMRREAGCKNSAPEYESMRQVLHDNVLVCCQNKQASNLDAGFSSPLLLLLKEERMVFLVYLETALHKLTQLAGPTAESSFLDKGRAWLRSTSGSLS